MKEDHRDLLKRKKDIFYNAKRSYGFEPADDKQEEILAAFREHKKIAVRSAHGFGKTALGAIGALDFLQNHRPSKVITTAPTWRQVKDIFWSEMRKWGNKSANKFGWEILPETPRIKTKYPDYFALGFSTDELDKFEGFHSPNLLVVVDEAKGVSEEIFSAIDSLLTTGNVKLIYLSTPGSPSGRFYNAFHSSKWKTFHITAFEAARVSEEWIEDMRDTYGEDSAIYQRKVLAEFTMLTEDPYFDEDLIVAAIKRSLYPDKPHVLGVDWGRHHDYTALVEVKGRKIVDIKTTQQDYMRTVGEISKAHNKDRFDKIVADLGAGDGQIDRMNELGLPIEGFRFTRRSKLDIMSNLKALFEIGEIDLPNHEWMKEQLISFEKSTTSSGDLSLNAPSGQFDDIVDALAMAMKGAMSTKKYGPSKTTIKEIFK